MPQKVRTVPLKKHREYIASYFRRNYFPGTRVVTPDDSEAKSHGVKGPRNGSWIDWKNGRLRNLGFYDAHNFRLEEINDSPPRVMLREQDANNNGILTEGHFEFKAYMQDKHEQDSRGEGSPNFLSSEQRITEEERANESEQYLMEKIREVLERDLFSNPSIDEGRHVFLIREIIGRVNPDWFWWETLGGDKFHGKRIQFPPGILERRNVVTKIAYHVVRTIISCSKNSNASDREVFTWMSFESSPSQEGNKMLDWAKLRSLGHGSDLLASDEEVEESIKQQFQGPEGFDSDIFEGYLTNSGQTEEEFRNNRKNDLTLSNLLENEVGPPEDRKWVDICVAGIKWLPLLGSKIAETILEARGSMLEICDNDPSEAKLSDSKIGLDEKQKKDLRRIKEIGFGGTKGIKKEIRSKPEKVIKHNSIKMAYNIKSILIKEGLLSTRKMTREEYRAYFLNDDESLVKSRQGKKWPGVLVFTPKMKSIIGDSEYENFRDKTENPIFRWIKMPRNRWMYCPPKPHRKSVNSLTPGGLLHPSLSKTVSNVADYEDFEVEDRRLGGGSGKVKTSKCEPNSELVEALNALQETQWEINLDLLEAMCEFDLVTPGIDRVKKFRGSLLDPKKDGLIHKIRPRKEFRGAFFDDDSEQENEGRELVLDWVRMIIEHNANVFWHSWVCDFRGRMFPRCSELSPHDGDLGKSLIRFKEWKPLGESGIRWLKVHVHNLMEGVEIDGIDDPAEKGKTFDERVEWVDSNEVILREVATKPSDHLVSLKLDRRRYGRREDFQRLAALIEFDRVQSEYNAYGDWSAVKSGLPIHLDASCNGYQHVSSLLRIKELAELVNVQESGAVPMDLYQRVADVAKDLGEDELRVFLGGVSLDKSLVDRVIEGVFDRSVAKKPTMVRVYGGEDVAKGLEGRRGRGRPDFSKPMDRNYSKSQKEKISKIPSAFKKAYKEYIDSGGKLDKSHFMQYSLNQKTGGPAKKKGEGWEKLLRPKSEMRLWAPGSSLYDAIIEPEGELADFFDYKEGNGIGWIHQQGLTDLVKGFYKEAIRKVTGHAYDELERGLSHAVNNSDGLWPGITWEVLPSSGDNGPGYVVHQYYIKRHGADDSRGGIPCHRGSTYTGLLPNWYSDTEYKGNKNAKSTSRLMVRAKELYGGISNIGSELSNWLAGSRWNDAKMTELLDKLDPDNSDRDASEIRNLMEHKDYSVQIYDENEKKRINRKKVSSSISPNFIHSLDAYHMRSVIREYAEFQSINASNISFWAVHDAFGTHACDIEILREVVMRTFNSLHGSNTLSFWLDNLQWVGKDSSPQLDPVIKIGNLWSGSNPQLSDYLIS